ncbi:MAG: 50S ribosomal protein L24 [Nanoarchaeota archaeon]|nr:50S ribosomal protein L24 [Nanoarchaeota archaeon]
MKHFSTSWRSSSNPRKQRKFVANAPAHIKRSLFNVHLAPLLRKKYNRRTLLVRKGDTVKILTGQFKKKSGKVERFDRSRVRIYVDAAYRLKRDGAKAFYPLHPSNVMITDIVLEDKERKLVLEKNMKGKQ